MPNHHLNVALDLETVRCLAVLGDPADVVARLAYVAADGIRSAGHPRRAKTDDSLRHERGKSDDAIRLEHAITDAAADEVLRVARERADQVVQTARDHVDADDAHAQTSATNARRARADGLIEDERADADAVLDGERGARNRRSSGLLAVERETTDRDLSGERLDLDALVVDQRDVNEQMVLSTLRAHDLAVAAEEARATAEENERVLRDLAEIREMYIGILGHDLRTPLSAIVMSTGLLLQRGHLDESDSVTVARIIRSSQRMSRMIAQMLDLTRARLGGGLPIETKSADLRKVCRDIVDEFDAPIEFEIEGDVTGVWDPDRLSQALSNVAGNAMEYATPGTPVIMKAYADGADAVVEISNQGDPIPADVLPYIFEPFRRAKQREKSPTGNLGLGLYIAHQIVLSHGGTLEARCAGGTTTFTMRLPRRAPNGA
jgi:signal transduction histidine kinase